MLESTVHERPGDYIPRELLWGGGIGLIQTQSQFVENAGALASDLGALFTGNVVVGTREFGGDASFTRQLAIAFDLSRSAAVASSHSEHVMVGGW